MFGLGKTKPQTVKTVSLAEALPVYLYEANKVVFNDGRVAVGFKVEAAEMERWGPDQFDSAWDGMQTALKHLPPGCVVQKTDIYYDRPYVHPPTPGMYFTQRMQEYKTGSLVLYYKGYVFLSFAPVPAKHDPNATKLKQPKPTNILNGLINRVEEKLPEDIFATVQATLAEAERYASEFAQAIRALPDVSLTRLSEHDIRQLYLQYMNLEFDAQPQHLEREFYNQVGTLAIGEQKVTAVSMTGQGTEVYPCVTNGYGVVSPMIYPLTNFLGVPHILTQSVLVQDTRAALADLDKDRRFNSGLSRFATRENHQRMAEIEAFSAEVVAEGKELVQLHLSMLFWETVDLARRSNVEAGVAALRSIFSSETAVESYQTLPLFMAALPGNGFQVAEDRWLPTTSDRASCYFHWTQTYRSTKTGEYLCDRFGNLKRVNLFDLNQDNQNSLTIGPSGSGKSFTMGHLIIQRYENGARQIIIDVGGSYRNVCQALTGSDFENTYFEYDPQNPIEFNPMLMDREPGTNRWLLTEEKTTFLLSLLGTLWKGTGSLDLAEGVVLGRYVKEYYAHLNAQPTLGHADEDFPGMNSFYRYVRQAHQALLLPADRLSEAQRNDLVFVAAREQYAKDVAYVAMDNFFLIVSAYTENGRYAKVLNARRDVDLSMYPLICFDMKLVQKDPTLFPVVAMLITELSLDILRRFPDDIKYVLMDEAWSMLKGALAEFIENMYRTIRKAKGSMGIITQSIDEIRDSTIGAAIIKNSATRIILRHKNAADRQSLQSTLGFTPFDMALIGSLREVENKSRELFIKQGDKATVFLLEPAPQLYPVLTSRPDHRNYLNRLLEYYQHTEVRPELDARGKIVVNEHTGQQVYTTISTPNLATAVDVFVETGGTEPEWLGPELAARRQAALAA